MIKDIYSFTLQTFYHFAATAAQERFGMEQS